MTDYITINFQNSFRKGNISQIIPDKLLKILVSAGSIMPDIQT